MKNKKTLLGLLLIVVMLLSTALFASCKKEENPDTGKGEIYYLYENGELNKSNFIQLKDGKWSDDDNESGTYVVSGTSITIYVEMMGEKEEYAKGTLKDGVLTLTIMGTEITYCKEGKTPSVIPSTPDDPEPGKQDEAVITAIKGAEINGTSIFMLVDKTTDSVSLSNKVTCSEGSVWKLYYDKLGQMEIPTKIAAGQSGELDDGDNTFYIVVTSGDSTKVNVYELKIHRQHEITVNYYDGENLLHAVKTVSGEEFGADYLPDIKGYTFNYWKISKYQKYSATVLYESISLYVDKTANKYIVTLNANGGNEIVDNDIEVTFDKSFKLQVPTREGYTFSGWYVGNPYEGKNERLTNEKGESLSAWNIPEDTTVNAKWEAQENSVTLNVNDTNAGTVSGGGEYKYDSEVWISAKTKNGYVWLGWYDVNNNLVSSDLTYIFKMRFAVTYTAKWSKVTVSKNISDAGTATSLNGKYVLGQEISVTAKSNLGYDWLGWYNDDVLLTKELEYNFKAPDENVTYIAKWKIADELKNFEFKSGTSYCEITGIKDKTVTEVIIPDYVTSIASSSFLNCGSLTSVTIGRGVKSIGDSVFNGCDGLKSVIIGNSVTSIGQRSFYNCSSLTSVNYAGTIDQWVQIEFNNYYANPLYYAKNLYVNNEIVTEVNITTATKINAYAFYGYNRLTSVTIGGSVADIGDSAFLGCNNLTKAQINDGVQSIGFSTFCNCENLNEITLPFVGKTLYGTNSTHFGYIFGASKYSDNYKYVPSSLKKVVITGGANIDNEAFASCQSITSIELGKGVHSIGYRAFAYCGSLASIVISENMTGITGDAFSECGKLTSVNYTGTIDQWVQIVGLFALMSKKTSKKLFINNELVTEANITTATKINAYAFRRCESLTSVTIGNSVTEIGSSAFEACSNLTSVTMGNGVTSTSDYSFKGCQNLKSITIGNSVTEIGYEAFYNCSNLVDVVIPDSVTKIDSGSFYNCSNLVDVVIPDSVTTISAEAFYNCSSLKTIKIPDSVTFIGDNALRGCNSLREIELPFVGASKDATGYSSVFGYIFGYTTSTSGNSTINGATYQYYESSLSSSYKYFYYYIPKSLVSVTIAGNCAIPDYAFYNCDGLINITLGEALTSIGKEAFYKCDNLTSIVIPDGVTNIGDCAFEYCKELASVIIGDNVTNIGDYAFKECKNLASVTIGNSVIDIGTDAFKDCYKLIEVINKSNIMITAGYSGNGYVGYYAKIIHTGESKIVNRNNYLFITIGDINYLIRYVGAETATAVSLPENYNGNNYVINSSAFRDCGNLIGIMIPDSVTSIGDYTFYNCESLTSVTIGDKVTNIGAYAFYDCKSLISVTIGVSVTDIGMYAFRDCDKLVEVINKGSLNITAGSSDYEYVSYYAKTVHSGVSKILNAGDFQFITGDDGKHYLFNYVGKETKLIVPQNYNGEKYIISTYAFNNCESLTSVTISDGVSNIGEYAFHNCRYLNSVVLSKRVTSIANSAFALSYLQNVYYEGTANDWKKISFTGNYGESTLGKATRYYYSESKPTGSGNYWHYVDGEIVVW